MTSINSLLIAVIAAVWGASSAVAADMALEASPTAPNCITCTNYNWFEATASHVIIGKEHPIAPVLADTPQRTGAAIKMVMGSTSAPQKPGGVGEQPRERDTPKPHKRGRHSRPLRRDSRCHSLL
jgi:hypothetical protein